MTAFLFNLTFFIISHHEMGIYDVPAVTQRILLTSGAPQLIYIGHSLGTSMLFVALSELPQMNNKIRAAFLLSPVAYQGHSFNPIRIFSSLSLSTPLVCKLRYWFSRHSLKILNIIKCKVSGCKRGSKGTSGNVTSFPRQARYFLGKHLCVNSSSVWTMRQSFVHDAWL